MPDLLFETDERLRPWAATISIGLLSLFAWSLIAATVRVLT